MAGRPKKIVESTETVNSEVVSPEVATETTKAPQKVLGGYTDQQILPIENVGVCIIDFFYDGNGNFINGSNTFIPGVKIIETTNEDGSILKTIVHINA